MNSRYLFRSGNLVQTNFKNFSSQSENPEEKYEKAKKEMQNLTEIFDKFEKSFQVGDYDKALESGQEYLNLAKDSTMLSIVVQLYMAFCHFKKNQIEQAYDLFDKSLALSKAKNGPYSNQVLATYLMWYKLIGIDEKFIGKYIEEMEKIAEECRGKGDLDKASFAEFLFVVGNGYFQKPDWDKTLKYLEECSAMKEVEIFDKSQVEHLYKMLAMTYTSNKNFKSAMEYAQKGKKAAMNIGASREYLQNYDQIIKSIEVQSKESKEKS